MFMLRNKFYKKRREVPEESFTNSPNIFVKINTPTSNTISLKQINKETFTYKAKHSPGQGN